jgi:hypothetical protein
MPDGHRRVMPQVSAVDELFGTHRRFFVCAGKPAVVVGDEGWSGRFRLGLQRDHAMLLFSTGPRPPATDALREPSSVAG